MSLTNNHSKPTLDDPSPVKHTILEQFNSSHEEISDTSTPSQIESILGKPTGTDSVSSVTQRPPQSKVKMNPFAEMSAKRMQQIGSDVIQALSEVTDECELVGFTEPEISHRQEEIFTSIRDTIATSKAKIHQERANIEDECEWLRQQIQLILSMVNDNKGDKSLSLIERGLAFKNQDQYEDGYKEQVLTKFSDIRGNTNFHTSSPFNIADSSLLNSSMSIEQQYDNMLNNIPRLTLLQQKSQLNGIFLKVLKSFMISFRRLNNLNLEYTELIDLIGPFRTSSSNIVHILPSSTDAEYHKQILDEFESSIRHLNLQKEKNFTENENYNTFILGSPRKNSEQTSESVLDHLRNINYQIIRIIRGLRFTKFTSDFFSSVQVEIDHCKIEIDKRKESVARILNQILESLELLQITDDKFKEMQKHNENINDDMLLDIETLKTIQKEPLEFGLHNSHIEFLSGIQDLLASTVNTRKSQWDEYSKTCMQLWNKLGETEEYVNSFMERNSSLTELSLLSFKMELNKLYIRRSECIEKFIADARNEIEKLWDKMYYSRVLRSEFEFFNYDPDNSDVEKETVLAKHEEEIIKLNEEYAAKEPIFQLYEELLELLKDQDFLKEASKDSSRLMSKNSCKILLNEEKLRKKINKNMPRVIDSLVSSVYEYNNSDNNGSHPLAINGEDLYEKLLSIQTEQQSNGPRRNRNVSNSSRVSPTKKPVQRISPQRKVQPTSRPESRLKHARESPTKVTRIAKPQVKLARTYNNPTTIKISNAITSSFSSASSNSGSPTRILGNISALYPHTELQPLNRPLRPLDMLSEQNSPLRLNHSPNQKLDSPCLEKEQDKENSSPFHLSPINIKSNFFERPKDIDRRLSTNTCDTSAMNGDEYQNWREERIRQYHGN
ncbi:uncharacterized protein SPAPADRAFT_56495 [Spathaspora passalidarum NRRL Y-27907]|uniref:Anaphase spindle elongation protein n=1 Tax=Spathaspora passalidarum (strain NRRL Y-27907 / 11-Y1) TaxID=619300 RepID=G3AR39_SPAPN|nr:uncharacterized protein SPAPADRAFT_56495 [Spathaspora passalidarum NRRL Y-27907]EGW31700.1 hypothetical protein SPAPADRAFT_56495 [Spathaspora passalidarum NRRL Y-27907]